MVIMDINIVIVKTKFYQVVYVLPCKNKNIIKGKGITLTMQEEATHRILYCLERSCLNVSNALIQSYPYCLIKLLNPNQGEVQLCQNHSVTDLK